MKQAQKAEQKKLKEHIDQNEKGIFDFIEDFSSSDYDSIDEEQALQMNLGNNQDLEAEGVMAEGDPRNLMQRLIQSYSRFERRKVIKE